MGKTQNEKSEEDELRERVDEVLNDSRARVITAAISKLISWAPKKKEKIGSSIKEIGEEIN